MTSVQLLHPDRWINRTIASILFLFVVACGACERAHRPHSIALNSPYEDEQIWAVAPLMNESGVSVIDTFRTADLLAQETEQVSGVHIVPVNRVIAAMRHLEMQRIASPADAMAIIQTLGVDGLIVGTITAYDPYPPITLGMAIELHRRPGGYVRLDMDPATMTRATSGEPSLGAVSAANPVAHAAAIFDASNQRVQAWVQSYAETRVDRDNAYGTDIYLVSMELYTKFVSYRLLHDLLAFERLQARQAAAQQNAR